MPDLASWQKSAYPFPKPLFNTFYWFKNVKRYLVFLAGLLAGWRDTSPCTVPHRASHTLIVGLYTLLLVNMLSVKTDFKSFHAISKQLLSFYCVEALWLLCFRDTKISKLLRSSVKEADTGTDKTTVTQDMI